MAEEKEAPKKVSRRQFVKGAAAVAGAGALASCAPAATSVPAEECPPCPTPWIPEKWDEEADVVVCGYGTAGMPAAIDAHDAGTDVLIIDKLDWLGGSCRRCGGGIAGAGTVVQKALGVEDSPDALYEYMVACGEGWTDPALHRVFADNAGKNVDWMIQDLGGQPVSEWEFAAEPMSGGPGLAISATPVFFEEFGMEPVLRCHWFTPMDAPWLDGMGGGTALFQIFDDAVKARQIRTMTGTGLIELVATPEREVLGIRALSGGNTLYVKAKKAVVLATGSFRHNEKMVRDFTPSLIGEESMVHADQAHGEALIAAMAVGADLVNMPTHTLTLECDGGLRINPNAEVIDVYGKPIPRLYAGGCQAGGTLAYKYPTCGTYVALAVSFGRIAGQNAAALEACS